MILYATTKTSIIDFIFQGKCYTWNSNNNSDIEDKYVSKGNRSQHRIKDKIPLNTKNFIDNHFLKSKMNVVNFLGTTILLPHKDEMHLPCSDQIDILIIDQVLQNKELELLSSLEISMVVLSKRLYPDYIKRIIEILPNNTNFWNVAENGAFVYYPKVVSR